MVIHVRLREERERLGLLQKDVAALVGMTPRAQLMYESGDRSPDSKYLAVLASAGFDVIYILTGTRSASESIELPRGVHALNGQILLGLQHWATLLNFRAEHGQGRDLLWGAALMQVLDGYVPAEPLQLAAQRFTQASKHGRTTHAVALYLVRNMPSAPWFIWPEGGALQEVYALDMGEDSMPVFVPDIGTVPAPALALSEPEFNTLSMGQMIVVDWHGADEVRDGERTTDYTDKTARAIKRAFASR